MQDFQSMKHLKLKPIDSSIMTNWLREIFNRQRELSKSYAWQKGKSPEEMTQIFAQAIASEAQELMNQTSWKPWKQTKKKFDRNETIYEYIDILHFVINGLITLDVDAEECMKYYISKNEENRARIERKY